MGRWEGGKMGRLLSRVDGMGWRTGAEERNSVGPTTRLDFDSELSARGGMQRTKKRKSRLQAGCTGVRDSESSRW